MMRYGNPCFCIENTYTSADLASSHWQREPGEPWNLEPTCKPRKTPSKPREPYQGFSSGHTYIHAANPTSNGFSLICAFICLLMRHIKTLITPVVVLLLALTLQHFDKCMLDCAARCEGRCTCPIQIVIFSIRTFPSKRSWTDRSNKSAFVKIDKYPLNYLGPSIYNPPQIPQLSSVIYHTCLLLRSPLRRTDA